MLIARGLVGCARAFAGSWRPRLQRARRFGSEFRFPPKPVHPVRSGLLENDADQQPRPPGEAGAARTRRASRCRSSPCSVRRAGEPRRRRRRPARSCRRAVRSAAKGCTEGPRAQKDAAGCRSGAVTAGSTRVTSRPTPNPAKTEKSPRLRNRPAADRLTPPAESRACTPSPAIDIGAASRAAAAICKRVKRAATTTLAACWYSPDPIARPS